MNYRQQLRSLSGRATPAPWIDRDDLYGTRVEGRFLVLGFAPHRPLDSRLIAVYRSALVPLLDAVDVVERFVGGVGAEQRMEASADVDGVLAQCAGTDRQALLRLDQTATPPLWDPGHVAHGMAFDPAGRTADMAIPAPADPFLIAAARSAVPRALRLLALAGSVWDREQRRGRLSSGALAALAESVAAFDRHRAPAGDESAHWAWGPESAAARFGRA